MIKGKQKHPSRICFECTHYEACQAWNVGTLVETDATHCVNYRASVGKTNADRIRSMTNEELDKFLGEVQWDVANYCGGVTQKQEYPVPEQRGAWLDWLKEEVSKDG